MKIKNLKELDVGVSGLKIEGDISYANPPQNRKGETKGRKYDFWSQFIRIEDDSDGIGCSITVGKEEDGFEVGDHITVMGKLAEYTDKNNDIQQVLNGQVVKNKEEKKEDTEKSNSKEDKNLMIAREVAIKASVELAVAKLIEPKDLLTSSDKLVKYIYEGNQKEETKTEEKVLPDKKEKPELARHLVKEGKLELKEGQTPLSEDEEVEELPEEIPSLL